MENKLQELTQKIYTEGVTKAHEEANAILGKARKDADELLKNARKQADDIVEKANQDAQTLRRNTESELAMSVKQAINAFKQELSALVATKASTPVKDAFKEGEFIRRIIETVVKNWNSDTASIDLSVLLPEADRKEMESYFSTKAKNLLDSGLELQFTNQVKAGFKIGPKDGSYVISFTDDDFENFFKAYARPKLRELLYGGK
jgi:V/A-type H+-transporting ATPase subunit E